MNLYLTMAASLALLLGIVHSLSAGRFDQRRVLQPEFVEQMLSELLPGAAEGETFGVYWVLGDNRSAQHGGRDPGISAQVGFYRNRGIGFVMLLNTDDAANKVVGRKLSAALKTFSLPEPAADEGTKQPCSE